MKEILTDLWSIYWILPARVYCFLQFNTLIASTVLRTQKVNARMLYPLVWRLLSASISSSNLLSKNQFSDMEEIKRDMINTWSCSLVSLLLAEAAAAMIRSVPAFLHHILHNRNPQRFGVICKNPGRLYSNHWFLMLPFTFKTLVFGFIFHKTIMS